MPAIRTILHVDMDAFFASVEQRDNPELRGKPILVGHDGPRSIVTTASYEARPFGCRSAQPMSMAKRLCPQAVIVPIRGKRYHEVSQQLFAILDQFSPLVEPISVDEAFIDATGCDRLFGSPKQMAERIRKRICDELQLTASVGIAPNKFLAKLASDFNKPDGLTLITPLEIATWLPKLSIGRMWGIGPKSAERLATMGVKTIGDLSRMSTQWMKQQFGSEADRFARLARGEDDRPVTPDSQAKSIGHEQTFDQDIAQADEVRRVLFEQTEQVARRLRKAKMIARTVSLKIRFGDFQTVGRSTTLPLATDSTDTLWKAAKDLFNRWVAASFEPVRLIGIHAGNLSTGAPEESLFDAAAQTRQRQVDQTADAIVARFGKSAIKRGQTLK